MNIQQQFADHVAAQIRSDENMIGLAAAGSWITGELDEYADLDLVLISKEKIGGDKDKMLAYAKSLGVFLSGFTGEHVGEPRVLICLYAEPLLHVDLKFLTLDEFRQRIENPVILVDKGQQLQQVLHKTAPRFPYPDYQWIEDRFWTWIHYALLKIGRGEYMEAYDFLGFLRLTVLGNLLHIKNGNLPRALRKVETQLDAGDLLKLQETLSSYSRASLLNSLRNAAELYRQLRDYLYPEWVVQHSATEIKVMEYFDKIEQSK